MFVLLLVTIIVDLLSLHQSTEQRQVPLPVLQQLFRTGVSTPTVSKTVYVNMLSKELFSTCQGKISSSTITVSKINSHCLLNLTILFFHYWINPESLQIFVIKLHLNSKPWCIRRKITQSWNLFSNYTITLLCSLVFWVLKVSDRDGRRGRNNYTSRQVGCFFLTGYNIFWLVESLYSNHARWFTISLCVSSDSLVQ